MIRNLFYFVYPLNGMAWRWNVRRILDHWGAFNGRRLVMIALDEKTESDEAVRESFKGHEASFETVKNDSDRWEAPYFTRALSTFRSMRADECTFHGHTKGQRHEGPVLESVLRWTDAMYVLNLGNPALIDAVLRSHPTAGCFKVAISYGGASWHYSGGFFWMRHDVLFSRDWDSPQSGRHEVEGYPGRLFSHDEAFDLTPSGLVYDLYQNAPSEETYRRWLADLVGKYVST